MTDWVRERRTVLGRHDETQQHTSILTLFIGLYNSANYWRDIVANLEQQTAKDVSLVIVDNASQDQTWDLLQGWDPRGFRSVVKVRNPTNLGGIGSLSANLDLFQTEWFATLHQDDIYYKNHVEVLLDQIKSAPPTVAVVTTSMDSLSPNGEKRSSIPRANWILDTKSPLNVFLAHLRFHALPFPAACFRVDALKGIELPWHDTSFPDTELVLRLCGDWEFRTSPVVTMAYRENPASESHVITSTQRANGQAQALIRVFSSMEFKTLLSKVDPAHRDDFFLHASESISMRFEEESLRQSALNTMADVMAVAWGYGSKAVNSHIQIQMTKSGNVFGESFFDFSPIDPPNFSHGELELLAPATKLRAYDSALLPLQRFLVRNALKLLRRIGLRRVRPDLDFDWRQH